MARKEATQMPLGVRLTSQPALEVLLASAIVRGCPKALPQVLSTIVHEWHLAQSDDDKQKLSHAHKTIQGVFQ